MNTALRDKALQLLSSRAHSRKELRDKLRRKANPDEAEMEEILDWLTEMGFLDDRSYAASVVCHCGGKGYGRQRAVSELNRRGIDRTLWEEALQELPETDEALDRLIRAKLRDPGDRDEVRKVYASMMRRGYSHEDVRKALERLQALEEYD